MQNQNAATVAEIDGARVFVTPMGMIFIFGFAKNYLLQQSPGMSGQGLREVGTFLSILE